MALSPEELSRRRRGRNWALILVLAAFAGLFFAISIVKLAQHPDLFTTSLDGPQQH
ncbi:MAG: cytochrome C oxidase assembly protein [Proteobacteria bacterium]|nr:cytochrome C oxidase assembly protein [Pseudomonadota bacterium]